MKITKEIKKELSKKLSEELNSRDILFTAFSGLKFDEINALREKLKPLNSRFSVTRNTIISHAADNARFKIADASAVKGPTAVVFIDNPDDISSVARILVDYAREKPSLRIKGGFVSKNWITPSDCLQISKIGSRKELLSRLVGALYTSMTQIRFVIEAPIRDLAYVLKALEEKKSKEK